MFWNKKKSGIVNVRMVITEEKILSNINKVRKLIDPNSKKSIVQLEDDTYFKDLVESIKMYLVEYPNKKTFPESVYKVAYELVEYATNQFEENTKKIEGLIRQREANIAKATSLKDILGDVQEKKNGWKNEIQDASEEIGEDIVSALEIIGRNRKKKSEEFVAAEKLVNARIANLESNLHIEIDMERIEDRSKALSYIGLEIADALKEIPAPTVVTQKIENVVSEEQEYIEETQVEVQEKKSIWKKIKESKFGKAISTVFKIRIVIDTDTLPEGRGD
jgi:hypothetical protein